MAYVQIRPIQIALHDHRTGWAIALFPLVFVMGMAIGKLMPRLYYFATREDSLVEWATAIIYIAAAWLAGGLARRLWRRKEALYAVLYGLLTVGLFLIAMEEISWGQRIFGFHTPPGIEALNSQGEMNFHNLGVLPLHEAYIVVGLYGAFARMIVAPYLGQRYPKAAELLTAPSTLCLYFAIPLIYYAYNEFLYFTEVLPAGLSWKDYWTQKGSFINGQDEEPIELLLSLGFLLFVLMNRNWYSPLPTSLRFD